MKGSWTATDFSIYFISQRGRKSKRNFILSGGKYERRNQCLNRLCKVVSAVLRLCQLVFIALRACDVIAWPWYKVLLPLFVSVGFWLLCVLIIGIINADDD